MSGEKAFFSIYLLGQVDEIVGNVIEILMLKYFSRKDFRRFHVRGDMSLRLHCIDGPTR